MPSSSSRQVTELLVAWGRGDEAARDRLIPLVYADLRRVAARHLRRERAGHSLQATALVHETYLRLVEQKRVHWQNRAHFFGVAARLMRRVLVDHARSRGAAKRGGGQCRVSLTQDAAATGPKDLELVALDEALAELEGFDPRQARIVELRFFGGLSIEETAEVLGVSPATVKREWGTARAWLHDRVSRTEAHG